MLTGADYQAFFREVLAPAATVLAAIIGTTVGPGITAWVSSVIAQTSEARTSRAQARAQVSDTYRLLLLNLGKLADFYQASACDMELFANSQSPTMANTTSNLAPPTGCLAELLTDVYWRAMYLPPEAVQVLSDFRRAMHGAMEVERNADTLHPNEIHPAADAQYEWARAANAAYDRLLDVARKDVAHFGGVPAKR